MGPFGTCLQVLPAAKGFSRAPADAAFLQPISATEATTAWTTRTRPGVLARRESSNVTTPDAASRADGAAIWSTTAGTTRTRPDVLAKQDGSDATTRDTASMDQGAAIETTTAEIFQTKPDAISRHAMKDSSSAPLKGGAYLRSTRAMPRVTVRMDRMKALALAPTVTMQFWRGESVLGKCVALHF